MAEKSERERPGLRAELRHRELDVDAVKFLQVASGLLDDDADFGLLAVLFPDEPGS